MGIGMLWLIMRESLRSFAANRGLQVAAALACYGFLAIMPLLLLLMSLLGLFIRSSDRVLEYVRTLTGTLFPSFNDALLGELMALSQSRVWGVITVVALFWSMTPFASAMRAAIRQIFRTERKLHFALGKLADLSAVLALLGLFVFLTVTRVYVTTVEVPLIGHQLDWLLPWVLTGGVSCFFYAVFAPIRLRAGELLTGAFTAAALLCVIRPIFALVLQHHPAYGYAFGSLKAIFVLIIWAHYTFAILLFGAEVMANVRRRESLLLRGLFAAPGAVARTQPALISRFVRRLNPGEVLFQQGDPGHEMFYVVSGSVILSVAGRTLRAMNVGDYFGEMSMLLNAPRTATATAEGETELIAISEANFETLVRENPQIVRTILKEMAERLRATTTATTPAPPPGGSP